MQTEMSRSCKLNGRTEVRSYIIVMNIDNNGHQIDHNEEMEKSSEKVSKGKHQETYGKVIEDAFKILLAKLYSKE
ncbi:hypothetical protein KAI36_03946 [Paenibacillus sp. S02]|nr:hypothetical protein KAI36_03946 [Paenibacillus sp. S02]